MADQLISTASHKLRSLPASYVRPESQRPCLHEVISDAAIPTVDLGSPDKTQIVAQIADTCSQYVFPQVVNHGVGNESMRWMMEVAQGFFRLPAEEKAKLYSDDPAKKIRLSTNFNIRKETVRNWRDYLRLKCVTKVRSVYCKEVRGLLGLISLGLGLEEEYMVKVLREQYMAINYYPKCPAPNLTYGDLQAHTDPNDLTILLQDHTVAGLQIRKDDKWIADGSHPHSSIINIGDQLQRELQQDLEVQLPPAHTLTLDLDEKAAAAAVEDRAVSNSTGGGGGRGGGSGRGPTAAAEEARVSNTSNLKTIAELAVPLVACIGLYATIHELRYLHPAFYFPLLIFLAFGACASLYSVFYHVDMTTAGEGRRGGEGEEQRELVKVKWLKVALICTGLGLSYRFALDLIMLIRFLA